MNETNNSHSIYLLIVRPLQSAPIPLKRRSHQPSSSCLSLISIFLLPISVDISLIARKKRLFSIPCGITGKRFLAWGFFVAISCMRPFARYALCRRCAGTPLCFSSRVGIGWPFLEDIFERYEFRAKINTSTGCVIYTAKPLNVNIEKYLKGLPEYWIDRASRFISGVYQRADFTSHLPPHGQPIHRND